MAALALATDSPSPNLLKRKPYGKNAPLITQSMWHNIIGQAAFQLFINLTILYFGHIIFGVEKDSVLHRTMIFNIFVFCQIFNELNSRKLGQEMNIFDGFFTNHICVAVLVFTVFVQFLIITFGGEFASTEPLSGGQWFACIFIGALGLPMSILIKMVPVPPEPTVIVKEEEEEEEKEEAPTTKKPSELWGTLSTAVNERRVELGIIGYFRGEPSKVAPWGFGVKGLKKKKYLLFRSNLIRDFLLWNVLT